MSATLKSFGFSLLVLALAAGGCSKSASRSPAPTDSGRVVERDVPVKNEQTADLEAGLEARLARDFEGHFASALAEESSLTAEARLGLARAAGLGASRRTLDKMTGKSPTRCAFNATQIGPWTKCLVLEVLSEDLSDADGLRALIKSAVREENKAVLGDLERVSRLASEAHRDLLQRVSIAARAQARLGKLLGNLADSVESLRQSIEILTSRQATLDVPFIGKSFFENRRFVLTTSLQQGSVGRERVYNLQSILVSLSVNSGRLVLMREGAGLYDSSSEVDLVVGSYPILSTRTSVQGEVYYQVDFSQPENKRFLIAPLTQDDDGNIDPLLDLKADVVVPRIAHAAKDAHPELGSGLYFDSRDASFVRDELVLLSTSRSIFTTAAETAPGSLEKDVLRPTVQVFHGLFALDESNELFEKTQSIDVVSAQKNLGALVEDVSQAKDVPYFATSTQLLDMFGRPRLGLAMVRKFNTQKEITWVVSENTPEQLVPAIKSVVVSYASLFKELAPAGQEPAKIVVHTQKEFEAKNRTEGLRIGGKLQAADPRVNMISWDDGFRLGAAWATSLAHPKTGEVLSADVMFSGSDWAMEGCMAFFDKTWLRSSERATPNRPASLVPTQFTRMLWQLKCERTLAELGIYRPFPESRPAPQDGPAGGDPAALDGDVLQKATQSGDAVALASLARVVLGRELKPADMATASAAKIDSESRTAPQAHQAAAATAHLREATRGLHTHSLEAFASAKENAAAHLKGASRSLSRKAGLEAELSRGESRMRARLDCLRYLPFTSADVPLSEGWGVTFTSKLIDSPAAGAIALVRSTALHELGHVFGLRHNFRGSRTMGSLAPESARAVPVSAGTDSIMDYNDYGVDLDVGAMPDITQAESVAGVPAFGLYDVFALSNLYGLDVSSYQASAKPEFCTDRNVEFLGDCQRYDFGKSYSEFLVHSANMYLQRLRYASVLDLVADPTAINSFLGLIQRVNSDVLKLAVIWGTSQQVAALSKKPEEIRQALQQAELAYRAQGGLQSFLTGFEARFEMAPLGVWPLLNLEPTLFKDEAFGEIFADMVRGNATASVAAVAEVLRETARAEGADAGFTGVLFDLSQDGKSLPYRSQLIEALASRVMVPAGTPLAFQYYDNGSLKSGADATYQGAPVKVSLTKPFFNSTDQFTLIRDLEIDDGQGGTRKVMATAGGKKSIGEMISSLAALKAIAPGVAGSGSSLRLEADQAALREILSTTCEEKGTVSCYEITGKGRDAASYVLGVYQNTLQDALRP